MSKTMAEAVLRIVLLDSENAFEKAVSTAASVLRSAARDISAHADTRPSTSR